MEKYTYDPLDLGGATFRLLRLHKGLNYSNMSCDLFPATRGKSCQYEALSYTWGSNRRMKVVTVNGKSFAIRENLATALSHLRYVDKPRTLWIDAICIDQDNKEERGHQVQQMGDIYKHATCVIFWLGLSNPKIDIFMESMQLLEQERTKAERKKWKKDDKRWKGLWSNLEIKATWSNESLLSCQRRGLEEILRREWFRRVWILQEVAHATAALVSCGKRSFSATLFAVAPFILQVEPNSHCQAVLDMMPAPWRHSSWWYQNRSLYTLLLHFGESKATESRDLIYALRGISSDANDSDILPPDYSMPEDRLVQDVLSFLHYHDGVDSLNHNRRPKTVLELVTTLRTLNHISCVTLAQVSDSNKVETLVDCTRGEVDLALLKTVVRNDVSGDFARLLFRRCANDLELDEAIFIIAVRSRNAPVTIFDVLLSYPHSITDLTRVAEEAALHDERAMELTTLLFTKRAKCIRITQRLFINFLKNKDIKKTALEKLVTRGKKEVGEEELIAFARWSDFGAIKMFLEIRRGPLRFTKQIIMSLVANKDNGADILDMCFAMRCRDMELDQAAALEIIRSFGTLIEYVVILFQPDNCIFYDETPRNSSGSLAQLSYSGSLDDMAFTSHVDTVYSFLLGQQDVKQDMPTSIGCALLHLVAKHSQFRILALLRSAGPVIGPSSVWALANVTPVSRVLFEHEADIKLVREQGNTPLIRMHTGHELSILQVSSTQSVTTSDIPTRALPVVRYCHSTYDILYVMLRYDMDNWDSTPLNTGIKSDCTDDNRAPAAWNAIIDGHDQSGKTPLIVAVERKHFRMMRLLLEHHARVDAPGYDGGTPLVVAVENNNISAVCLLLQYYANVNAIDPKGKYPLLIATEKRNIYMMRLLLEYRAHTESRVLGGNTPLLVATERGDVEMLRLLLEHRARVEARCATSGYKTPLIIAAEKNDVATMRLLLAYGADIEARDAEGCTALIRAVSEPYQQDAVRLLLQYGASEDVFDGAGRIADVSIIDKCYVVAGKMYSALRLLTT